MFDTLLLSLVFVPIILGLVLFSLRALPKSWLGYVSAGFALLQLGMVLALTQRFLENGPLFLSYSWAPQVLANFSMHADGLALFFALLITGMGTLVSLYSQWYMDASHERIRRFYAYLNIFMGAMLGAVLSDNLILFFLFWELTGLTSYWLISYRHEDVQARIASRSAFLLNALAAVGLLGAIILIGVLDGTLEWSEVATKGLISQQHPFWIFVIMGLLLVAVGAKSAQFPLHFWLPEAMVAPTPVSAYLHSATMVKLGIYLVARSYVLFVDSSLWFPLVTTFSVGTVVVGGIFALFAKELKRTLAYATISQLGFFISFYGIGYPEGLEYDYLHIFNHALYKGSLFMLVGILAHSAGVTQLREMPGLAKKMPLFAVAYAISLAAMAGVPGTTGFLSKELVVRDLIMLAYEEPLGAIVFVGLILGLVIKVAFSYRLFHYFFLQPAEASPKLNPESPRFRLLFSPLVLSSLALILGIWPAGIETLAKLYAVEGLHLYSDEELALWHGFTANLLISALIFLFGIRLFRWTHPREGRYSAFVKSVVAPVWHGFVEKLPMAAARLTSWIHHARAEINLRWILLFASCFALLGALPFVNTGHWPSQFSLKEITSCFLILTCIAMITLRGILGQVLALGLMGFLVTLYFAVWGAVDLAMTQMLVEVAVLFALVLVGLKLPQGRFFSFSWTRSALSLLFGFSIAAIPFLKGALLSTDDLGAYYLAQAQPLAKGANVVNTILVDFRALDTLGEVAVVLVAALGVAALLLPATRWVRPRLNGQIPTPAFGAVSSFILAVAVPFSLYLLLRGHDFPGGGFIGSILLVVAVVLREASLSKETPHWLRRVAPLPVAFLGLLLTLLASTLPLALGNAFFEAYFPVESTLVSTPVLFDLGIYLLVLGATCSMIDTIRQRTLGGASA